MDENNIELTPEILEEVSGGLSGGDVFNALDGLIKQYVALGLTQEQLIAMIQSGAPVVAQILKDITIGEAVEYVKKKWKEYKGG